MHVDSQYMQELEVSVGSLEVGELLARTGLDYDELAQRILARKRERGSDRGPLLLDPNHFVARLTTLCALTHTEQAVALLLFWGATDRQIAEQIGCSERTAKRHVAHVLAKAGAPSRSALVRVLFEDAGISEDEVLHRAAQLRQWSR